MFKVRLLEPAKEFIDSVNKKMQVKILRTIDLLVKFGPFLKEPHSKKLKDNDIQELRVKLASDIVRLFYFYDKGQYYVITSGFVKKKNKTSSKEIKRALRLKKEFEE